MLEIGVLIGAALAIAGLFVFATWDAGREPGAGVQPSSSPRVTTAEGLAALGRTVARARGLSK